MLGRDKGYYRILKGSFRVSGAYKKEKNSEINFWSKSSDLPHIKGLILTDKTKITVVGSGYVGMSLAVLLAQHNDVVVLDVDPARVDKVNNKQSTVADAEIEAFLSRKRVKPNSNP